jgi:hypothetical protein
MLYSEINKLYEKILLKNPTSTSPLPPVVSRGQQIYSLYLANGRGTINI